MQKDARAFSDILQVDSIRVEYKLGNDILRRSKEKFVSAVDGVSFRIRTGTTFGLVGESGCGKSTIARAILRLIPLKAGKIVFGGHDISDLRGKDLLDYRRNVQVVFQDPYGSLDPRQRVLDSVVEPLKFHGIQNEEALKTATNMLTEVGLRREQFSMFPHQFSGGQRQRICIARSLALNPKLLILDEPTSALDVSIQAQLLILLKNLQLKFGLTYLFISHNLAVVKMMSDFMASMYDGKIVEAGDTGDLFAKPEHPYTQRLISAIPEPFSRSVEYTQKEENERILPKRPLKSLRTVAGCSYREFCPYSFEKCVSENPLLKSTGPDHQVSCHLYPNIINNDIRRSMNQVVNRKRNASSLQKSN